MTDKLIKNEKWTISELASKVNTGTIYKPKYQRKRKWDVLPKKENVPSERKFIEFLYEAQNSVHTIAFGSHIQNNKQLLSNIDGNNRINAIMHFLQEPFTLFPENLDEIKKFIIEKIKEKTEANNVINFIEKITYDQLMTFKYTKYFTDKGYPVESYEKYLKMLRDELEDHFGNLSDKMKINNKERFDEKVVINVILFQEYSTEELSDVFGKINKYNSGLTEQEALASRLFNITNFTIEDGTLNYEIKQNLKEYYRERTDDEILKCYVYDETNDSINAYDFMVGFQNYSNKKCPLIQKTDNDGLSLFFKIFKAMYKHSLDTTFTTENVNYFIEYMKKTINILQTIKNKVFMENLVGGTNKIFDAANKKLYSLKKNNVYLIIAAIIGYLKNNVSDDEITNSIVKSILYHFFVHGIEDKEQRDQYKLYSSIVYEAGGSFIDNKAKEFLKNPSSISDKITKESMKNVLNILRDESVKNRSYEIRKNGKDKYDKRRQRKLHEKVLIYNYYVNSVPRNFLENNFWLEHIFPFSCSWEDEIDIDRLGNIIPIIEELNKERSNKHINEYKKIDKNNFLRFIENIPTSETYDNIVTHEDTKPYIYDSEKYNDFCYNNEKKLINCLLKKMYA